MRITSIGHCHQNIPLQIDFCPASDLRLTKIAFNILLNLLLNLNPFGEAAIYTKTLFFLRFQINTNILKE